MASRILEPQEPPRSPWRDPRVREPKYLAWVAKLPCVACFLDGRINWKVHVAHIRFADAGAGWRSVGMQEKPADRRTAPLCPRHHTDGPEAQHRMNERAFWEVLGIDPIALTAELSRAFDAGKDGLVVIATAVGRARAAIQGRG